MNFTFGIVTAGSLNPREKNLNNQIYSRIKKIISTIKNNKIPKYQIIIIGGENYYQNIKNLIHVPFKEDGKNLICIKKNLITKKAKYENIVYMHDYFALDKKWYKNMKKYKSNFDIMMNQILDNQGNRYHDWSLDDECSIYFKKSPYKIFLPYNFKKVTRFQYISGGFWIAKKKIMNKYPLNEKLQWMQAEDKEWSYRVLNNKNNIKYVMNQKSKVHLLKNRYAKNYQTISEIQKKKLLEMLRNNYSRDTLIHRLKIKIFNNLKRINFI